MKTRLLPLVSLVLAAAIAGCSADPITDSLAITYGAISVTAEKAQGRQTVNASISIKLVNRTEHGMNIAFTEAAILDPATKRAVARFRPIIPQSYGSFSYGQLLPKQTREYTVITPPDLDAFDLSGITSVVVSMSLQTTDGYRAEVVSGPVAVVVK